MAVLTRSRWIRVAALALLASACVVFPEADRGLVFSHATHMDLERLQCRICHVGIESSDDPGMPTPRICAVCHEKIDAEKPAEKTAASQFDAAAEFIKTRRRSLSPEIRFSHQTHVVNHGIACGECHAGIEQADGLAPLAAHKGACVECHAERGFRTNCDSCHREITQDTRPANHSLGFIRSHGDLIRGHHGEPGGGSANRCDLCHNEARSSCAGCHREQLPRSHTNHWRRHSHGIATSADRSACATCHTSSFCNECHESTRPRSHRATFGSPQNQHCKSCHFPLQEDGCQTCHRGTPSHDRARPLPANHHPAMNCRQCHGVTVKLPHPDPGATCTRCHR